MKKEEQIREFRDWQKRLSAYRLGLTLLAVDANSKPSLQGAAYRGERTAILEGEYRRLQKDSRMFEITGLLYEEKIEGDLGREIELVYQELQKDREIPAEDYIAYEKILDASRRDWLRAKAEGDYKGYAPYLKEVIDGYRRLTSMRTGEGSLYDRMLDDHHPGWGRTEYDRFFSQVKEQLLPLLAEIRTAEPIDCSFLNASYDIEKQREVMKKINSYLGFSDSWGRMAESEHPLTTWLCRGDIRFTTKFRERNVTKAILSTVHEVGHAWYAHNVSEEYEGTAIAETIRAGMHESQSRLCENHLGRSLAFWQVNLPKLQSAFPDQLSGITPEELYRALNAVNPSLIRIEADEVTYPLHIMIRYELEKEMMDQGLSVKDLEEAWNEKYRKYLGLVPASASEGILQDMHWPYAYFGYFPTYALGSAIAAQIYQTMEKQIDVTELLLSNRYPDIMRWLEEKVHRYGNRYDADTILKMVTGEAFSADAYCSWLNKKYRDLYHLS